MSELSTNLIEIALEQTDPAEWAAVQLVKVGRDCKTVGEAMEQVKRIVRESWAMQRAIEKDNATSKAKRKADKASK